MYLIYDEIACYSLIPLIFLLNNEVLIKFKGLFKA